MANREIIRSVKDAIAIALQIAESAENEVAWLVHRPAVIYASQYGINERAKMLIQKGGRVRGITDISYPYIDVVRERLDIGEDVRHLDKYQGEFMLIGDVRQGLSSINIDVESLSLDTPVVALWTDDPTYAEYLISTFEIAWEQSVPAAQRIEELLKEGPPNI